MYMGYVYPQLKYSPYYFTVPPLTYFFSTKGHCEKFKTYLEHHRVEISQKLEKRYKIKVNCPLLADINLYREIENRGFYITNENGEVYEWQEQVELNGLGATLKKLQI